MTIPAGGHIWARGTKPRYANLQLEIRHVAEGSPDSRIMQDGVCICERKFAHFLAALTLAIP